MQIIVYTFPNLREAANMFKWLQHYNLKPKWGNCSEGGNVITLPKSQVPCLQMMQKNDPARFGNYRKYTI